MWEKWFDWESLEMATEKTNRSRWYSGVREADRQISTIFSGSFSDLTRDSAALAFSLVESEAVGFGEGIEEK